MTTVSAPPAGGNRQARYDLAETKAAATGRWAEIISSLASIDAGHLDSRHHECPRCGGRDRFRAFGDFAETGGAICNQCLPGGVRSGLDLLVAWCGWPIEEAVDRVGEFLRLQPREGQPRRNGAGRPARDSATPPAATSSHPRRRKRSGDPAAALRWTGGERDAILVGLWASKKPPITPQAVADLGMRYAEQHKRLVLAAPVWSPSESTSEPCGYVLAATDGHALPVGNEETAKYKLTAKSAGGLLIPAGQVSVLAETPGRRLVVAGLPDELTAIDLCRGTDIVPLSSACGENYLPLDDDLAIAFGGREVRIIYDADQAGDEGAAKIGPAIARHASSCGRITLPWPSEWTGPRKDLRDWAQAGGTLEQLLELWDQAEMYGAGEAPPAQQPKKSTDRELLSPGDKVRAADRDNIGTVVQDLGSVVSVRFVSPEGTAATVDLSPGQLRRLNGDPVDPSARVQAAIWRPDIMPAEAFFAADFRQHYLVDGVLAEGQQCIVGGPSKVMKTSLLIDLALSLATGSRFLGEYYTHQRRVLLLSGESGRPTVQETAARIARAKEVEPSQMRIGFGFTLPQIANPADLDLLHDIVVSESAGYDVVILDPTYLCLLGGDTRGRSTANIFDMGSLLLAITEWTQAAGVTLIMAHHCRKGTGATHEAPALEDLSMAGFAEWARQWILIGRRSKYQGDGEHRLWLNIGGSAGHYREIGVDVSEGTIDQGRHWSLAVRQRQEIEAEKRERREEQQAGEQAAAAVQVVELLAEHPEGLSQSKVRDLLGRGGPATKRAIADAAKEGWICSAMVQAGRSKCEGWVISEAGVSMVGHGRTRSDVRPSDHSNDSPAGGEECSDGWSDGRVPYRGPSDRPTIRPSDPPADGSNPSTHPPPVRPSDRPTICNHTWSEPEWLGNGWWKQYCTTCKSATHKWQDKRGSPREVNNLAGASSASPNGRADGSGGGLWGEGGVR